MKKETKEKIMLAAIGIGAVLSFGYLAFDNIRLYRENEDLKGENEKTRGENETLKKENSELRGENKTLERENRRLGKENGNLTYQIGKKEAERRGIFK